MLLMYQVEWRAERREKKKGCVVLCCRWKVVCQCCTDLLIEPFAFSLLCGLALLLAAIGWFVFPLVACLCSHWQKGLIIVWAGRTLGKGSVRKGRVGPLACWIGLGHAFKINQDWSKRSFNNVNMKMSVILGNYEEIKYEIEIIRLYIKFVWFVIQ